MNAFFWKLFHPFTSKVKSATSTLTFQYELAANEENEGMMSIFNSAVELYAKLRTEFDNIVSAWVINAPELTITVDPDSSDGSRDGLAFMKRTIVITITGTDSERVAEVGKLISKAYGIAIGHPINTTIAELLEQYKASNPEELAGA